MKTPKEEGYAGGLSRRRFIASTTAAGVGASIAPDSLIAPAAAQQRSANSPEPPTDVALVNGRIHTLDARNTVANSVTIRNGRIAAVGGNPPSGVRRVDLRGRTVVPGLIEGHVHIVSLANRPGYHTILENTASIREIQEALAARDRKSVV